MKREVQVSRVAAKWLHFTPIWFKLNLPETAMSVFPQDGYFAAIVYPLHFQQYVTGILLGLCSHGDTGSCHCLPHRNHPNGTNLITLWRESSMKISLPDEKIENDLLLSLWGWCKWGWKIKGMKSNPGWSQTRDVFMPGWNFGDVVKRFILNRDIMDGPHSHCSPKEFF